MRSFFLRLKEVLSRFFHRRRLIRYAVYAGILLLLFLFRYPILRGIGNFLIAEDSPLVTEYVFVLGGSPLERGTAAAVLYKEGRAKYFVCTGSQVHPVLEAAGDLVSEAALTARYMERLGVPSERIIVVPEGTSTYEEGEVLREFCLARGISGPVTVLSSKFHTRRVRRVFRKAFRGTPVQINMQGAPSLRYQTDEWWEKEEGLLMVNNEYVKLVYYAFFR